jgi:DNA-binding ferritin-like protein
MKLKLLNAVMRLYESNIRNLHWNSAGEEFNDAHKSITEEYYELLSESIDKIAEIMGIYDIPAPNYVEVITVIRSVEKSYTLIDSSKLYNRGEIIVFIDTMFEDIIELLDDIIENSDIEMNAGVRSELETILYEFTFQKNYINKRRLTS